MRLTYPKFVSAVLLMMLLMSGSAFGQATLEAPPENAEAATETQAAEPAGESAENQKAPPSPQLKRVTYDIKYLASDELGGRKPGTDGIEKAAKYIEDIYKEIGLKPLDDGSYRQKFDVRLGMKVDTDATALKFLNPDEDESVMKLELGKDYMPQASRRGFDLDAELVFVGYGINAEEDYNYNDYRDVDVDGKIVVLIRREPQLEDEDSVFEGSRVSRYSYIQTKTRAAREAGAVGIVMVNDGVNATDDERDTLEDSSRFRATLPLIQIKRRVFNELLKQVPLRNAEGKKFKDLSAIEKHIDETLSPVSQPFGKWKAISGSVAKENKAETSNIVGIIEGEGPNAEETIVIGGHYDHLGMGGNGSRSPKREVHNGADDNATGTAAVIELARRFAARDAKPARRLVFVCFTAEEMGLLGAYHYTSEPLFPLDGTAAMVNFDMIGWLRDDTVTIFNATSAPEFDTLLDRANEKTGLEINKSAGFGGSDHLPFFQKKIPVMFVHTLSLIHI